MKRFCVVDVETTGSKPEEDAIIQIAAVLLEDSIIKNEFSTYVFTDKNISRFIKELTGITDEHVDTAPLSAEVMPELLPLLEGAFFVAHNASFDLNFVNRALIDAGYREITNDIIDSIIMSKILLPSLQSHKLDYLTQELEIKHVNPHNALDDALATADLLRKMINILETKPLTYLQQLQKLLSINDSGLFKLVDSILNKAIISGKTQLVPEQHVYNYFTLKNIALRVDDEKAKDEQELDFDTLFSDDGYLANAFPQYEYREGQEEMASEVRAAFYENRHLMIEAGTGTGKTLAYLLPAIYWALEEAEQVVISTHTINLQEQLYKKDIPLLKESMGLPFKAAILKGRNNYLCLRKFALKYQETVSQPKNTENSIMWESYLTIPEETVELARFLTWVSETETGDIEELNLSLAGRYLWNEMKSESESCLNRKCPWFKNCYYHRAKKLAQQADIIITNHALLLTSLKNEQPIIPNFRKLIIDEAHQLENVAINHLGYEVSQLQIMYILNKLHLSDNSGILARVSKEIQIRNETKTNQVIVDIKEISTGLLPKIIKEIEQYFTLLDHYLSTYIKRNGSSRRVLRMKEQHYANERWKHVNLSAENLLSLFNELINFLESANKAITDLIQEENLLADYEGNLQALGQVIANIADWNEHKTADNVYWIESRQKGKRNIPYLLSAPIEIGKYLQESLIGNLDSVVMTSATLSVMDSFEFISNDFGFELDDDELTAIIQPSPFNYQKQVRVYVPDDVPAIKDVSVDTYVEYISKNIAEVALLLEGRTLVLFTSHAMLQKSHRFLVDYLKDDEIKVLGQNIDSSSRSKLTETFLENSNTILLGTNSFWEGVDIPGENLSALCIVRLPFIPPDEPVQAAREERLKAAGKNSFTNLSLPQAIIRFKQGFGRLIRTHQDRGVVIIFDNRIITTWYGKAFIQSLPQIEVDYMSSQNILRDIESWFF